MTLDHEVAFGFVLSLAPAEALEFVRDVRRSLARAGFLRSLRVEGDDPRLVTAELPVESALLGRQSLPFRSALEHTPRGARLVGMAVDHDGPGWAEVHGEAEVEPSPEGTWVGYRFRVRVHLCLPEPRRWGEGALLRMIEYTSRTVVGRLTAALPEAFREAAREMEAAAREMEAAAREMEAAAREMEAAAREMEAAGREMEAAGREVDGAVRDTDAAAPAAIRGR